MPKFTFQRGLRVIIDANEFVILRRLSDRRLQFENIRDGELVTLSETQVLTKYIDEKFQFIAAQGPDGQALEDALAHKLQRDLASAHESEVKKMQRRLAYVTAIVRASPLALTQERLDPILKNTAARIGDAKAPSWISGWRWYHDYTASGRDPRSLLASRDRQGNHKPRHRPEVYDLTRQARDEIYLALERKSVLDVEARAVVLVDDLNRFRDPSEILPYPRRGFINKIIQEIDPYDRMVARYGKRSADMAFRVSMVGPRPSRPLERVEMDHTKADLFVIDHRYFLPLGRPWVTTCLDVQTKCPLGYYLGFEPPSFLSVMACLKHAILPKTYVRQYYPEIVHDWDCHGIMETLVVDNAPEFHSLHLESACLALGADLQFTKVKVPWFKGPVERFQRTLNHDLLHGQPGTTFSNIFELDEYDPAKHAVITLAKLDEAVHRWTIDYYNQRPQGKGKDRDTPAHRWQKGVAAFAPALPESAKALDAVLGKTIERKLHHYGIELFEGLYYNSDALGAIRREHGKNLKVVVTYSPRDLSRLFVQDPGTDLYVKVQSLDLACTAGLSEWTYKVLLRYVKNELKQRVNYVALMHAREAIRKLIEAGLGRSRHRTRQRAARFEGTDNSSMLAAQAESIQASSTQHTTHGLASARPPVCDPNPPASFPDAHTGISNTSPPAQSAPHVAEDSLPDFEVDHSLQRTKTPGAVPAATPNTVDNNRQHG